VIDTQYLGVSLDMIVGALAVFPPQKDAHLVKLVFTESAQFSWTCSLLSSG
jgi:hypothetical protein